MNHFYICYDSLPQQIPSSWTLHGEEALEAQLEKLQGAGLTLHVGGPWVSWGRLGMGQSVIIINMGKTMS